MIEKPNLPDALIVSVLQKEYGLRIAELTFLPLGWDVNTAVYRVVTPPGSAYFLKLRKGSFNPVAVALPQFLAQQGIPAIIPPIETRSGRLWGQMDPYKTILYPFVEGQDGYETTLTLQQWTTFGATLRAIHATDPPQELTMRIQREDYSNHWRELTLLFLQQVQKQRYEDPIAAKTGAFLRDQHAVLERLARHAGKLADELRSRSPRLVLCHNDVHAGNLLVTPGGRLYLVDWDEPIFAPRERDLALIGGSRAWHGERETDAFYTGYGPSQVDPVGLAYYRCERIVVDIAEFCKQLLPGQGPPEDREQSYRYLTGLIEPGGDLEIATRGSARGSSQDV